MTSGSSTEPRPLRLVVFDATRPILGPVWWLGGRAARLLWRVDGAFGARSWAEALDRLATAGAPRRIGSVQFWMHGHPGRVHLGGVDLDAACFDPGHRLGPRLAALRARLSGPGAAVWFRTCGTFGGRAGHAFARAAARFLGCRVAGHTHVIWAFQSGSHVLGPAEEPDWPEEEGLAGGDPARPERLRVSWPWRARTVTGLRMKVPD